MQRSEAQRWALFQQEALGAALALQAALAGPELSLDEAGRAVFTLSTTAALVHLDPLLRLGRAMRAALSALPATSQLLAEPARQLLQQAAAVLPGWLAGLAHESPEAPPELLALLTRLEALARPPGDDPRLSAAHSSSQRGSGSGRAEPSPLPSGPEVFVPLVDEDMIEPFIEEASERLEALAQKLVRLERSAGDQELISDVFRDLHTIKGSSGFVGLRTMNRLAHAAEDLVGQLRAGTRTADRPTIDALLRALDGLRAILGQAVRRAPIDIDLTSYLRQLQSPSAATGPPGPHPEARHDGGAQAGAGRQTLRVDFDKLDLLLNLVGELVLGKSRLHDTTESLTSLGRELALQLRRARQSPPGKSQQLLQKLDPLQRLLEQLAQHQDDGVAQLDHIAAELRGQVMRLRMVPIGRIFNKYHRTVRELGHTLGRRVRLEIEGADTELDKMLVEQLDDPLLHLVRNAIDHGIEAPGEREARGKPPEGRLRLRAYHDGSQIVVEISDDGRGIDEEAVRRKAVANGLITEAEAAGMERQQLMELLFRPGFSTTELVSEVSGRGVGLDVVQQTVQRLKGAIEIRSRRGEGSAFVLRLPLTLAIIQVLTVQVAGEVYAMPLEAVGRVLQLQRDAVQRVYDRDVLLLDAASDGPEGEGGEAEVPLIDLAQVLGLSPGVSRGEAGGPPLQAILIEHSGTPYGLLCDRQLGKREIVIKSLGALLDKIPCVGGATLIDDRVVLLLDLGEVVQRAAGQRHAPPPAPSAAAPRQGGAARVLVAEDSPPEREALCQLLRSHGYEVVSAPDGQAAAALAARDERGFDIVTTDVTMPHVDGYELTRLLRDDARHGDVPIIMITARAEPLDRVRGFDAGVDEYLTKPVDPALLLRTLARHLSQHHARKEDER